jgi:hypothetical protein
VLIKSVIQLEEHLLLPQFDAKDLCGELRGCILFKTECIQNSPGIENPAQLWSHLGLAPRLVEAATSFQYEAGVQVIAKKFLPG